MKRIISFFITGMLLCVLWSSARIYGEETTYSESDKALLQAENTQDATKNETEVSEGTTEENTNTTTTVDTSNDTKKTDVETNGKNVAPPSVNTVQDTASKITPTTQDYGSYESVEFAEVEEVKETEVGKITTEIADTATHTAVRTERYYQYSTLRGTEQTVYQTISQAMKNADSIVDLSSYGCSMDALAKIYQYVVADNPQYFYLAKNYGYTYNSNKQTIKQLILMYTDGTTVDQYDGQGNLATAANRSLISQQIATFNGKISNIISSIPISASDLEKEKKIYNYIQDNVAYDHQAAALVNGGSCGNLPHAFDAYGAACEGLAVCEGYAELFQYLCYCIGINATQVYGTAMGGSHMWNAVKIENEWYMLDLTWDDCGKEGLYCYTYFNLTTSEMSKDHSVDSTSIKVPACVSTTYAYYNYYALYVKNTSVAPANHIKVLDYLATSGDKYLCVYIGNQTESMQKYITSQVLSENSEVQKYISSMNYAISLANSYYQIEKYCYIPRK